MDNNYLNITPQLLAVECVERAAGIVPQATQFDPIQWWFIITDIHTALTAQLVASLSGTMQIGALVDEHQKFHIAHWNNCSDSRPENPVDKKGRPFDDKIAFFSVLMERACNPHYEHKPSIGSTLCLSPDQKKDIESLNKFRNDLAHVQPRQWYLEIGGLPRIIRAASSAITQLFESSSQRIHLRDEDITRMDRCLKSIDDNLQTKLSTH